MLRMPRCPRISVVHFKWSDQYTPSWPLIVRFRVSPSLQPGNSAITGVDFGADQQLSLQPGLNPSLQPGLDQQSSLQPSLDEIDVEKREHVFKEDGQEYAQVLRMLENGRCEAMSIEKSKLLCHICGKMQWKHQLCKNSRPNPDIKTLFIYHTCGQQNGARAPSPVTNPLLGPLPKAGGFPHLGVHGPFQPTEPPGPTQLAGWMTNSPMVAHPAVSGGPIGLGVPSIPVVLKHPKTLTNPSVEYLPGDPDHLAKRARPMGIDDEVNLLVNVLPFPAHGHSQAFSAPNDLSKTIARSLIQGSSPMSMDFHPIQQTLLLVSTKCWRHSTVGSWLSGEAGLHKF